MHQEPGPQHDHEPSRHRPPQATARDDQPRDPRPPEGPARATPATVRVPTEPDLRRALGHAAIDLSALRAAIRFLDAACADFVNEPFSPFAKRQLDRARKHAQDLMLAQERDNRPKDTPHAAEHRRDAATIAAAAAVGAGQPSRLEEHPETLL